MNIISDAISAVKAGISDTFAAFSKGAVDIETQAEKFVSSLSPQAQAIVASDVAQIKQGLAAGIQLADTLAAPFLTIAATDINAAFTKLATSYFGPSAAGLTPERIDMVNTLRDHLKSSLDAEALSLMSSMGAAKPVSQS